MNILLVRPNPHKDTIGLQNLSLSVRLFLLQADYGRDLENVIAELKTVKGRELLPVYSVRCILKRTVFTKSMLRRPFQAFFYLFVNLYYRKQIKHGIVPNII